MIPSSGWSAGIAINGTKKMTKIGDKKSATKNRRQKEVVWSRVVAGALNCNQQVAGSISGRGIAK